MLLNIPKHKNILFQILKDIYSDTRISPFLGFKGGTAAYMFYDLSRFSVDLDFDLLNVDEEENVFSRVEDIVKKYGQVKESRMKRYNLFFLLSYGEKAQNIKVEINRRSFSSEYELKTSLGVSMLVMNKDDMFAHKLMAMYERMGKSNRDIYDVWFFLKNNWSINKKIVIDRSEVSFSSFLNKCIVALEKFENRKILSGMGELLDQKQKVWVKEHLKEDTIFLLRLLLDAEK
ncbi:MAG: nucleotidyl transferase AbiEii/AbiGii toxin family protein [Patescibacteria group bacterium]